MREQKGRVAVVTGAFSGIGGAIASRLAQDGWRVIGTSRKPLGVGEQQLPGIERRILDVTEETSIRAFLEGLAAAGDSIELLVNNAGYLQAGAVEEVSILDAQRQFETNYFGAVRMINAVLPRMREVKGGRIINITSLAGIVPLPFWGHYNASKAALESLSETLRQELAPFGIHVSCVEPGAIKTPFYAVDRQAVAQPAYQPWRERFNRTMKRFEEAAPGPELVAKTVARIAASPRPALRYRVTREATIFNLMRAWLPAGLYLAGQRRGLRLDDPSN